MQIFSLSLLLPVAYLSILIGSLATFSHLYRRRQLHAKLRLAPYFPPHTSRNIYLSLLHLQDQDQGEGGAAAAPDDGKTKASSKTTKVPESVIRAALLTRACTDIERILEIRQRKPALNQLLQRGVVGDEIWQRLLRAEQELEMEVKDVVSEANALSPGWGAVIFQSAGEMVQNRILRQKLDKVRESTAAEKEEWERTKERARKELMGEGDAKDAKDAKDASKEQAAEPRGSSNAEDGSQSRPATASVNSDDDGVLVEHETTTASANTAGGGGSSGSSNKKKKKKNKGANKQDQ